MLKPAEGTQGEADGGEEGGHEEAAQGERAQHRALTNQRAGDQAQVLAERPGNHGMCLWKSKNTTSHYLLLSSSLNNIQDQCPDCY